MRELLESEILNYLCGPRGGSLWLGGSSHTWLRSPSYQLAAGGARAVRAVRAGVLTLAPAVCLAAPACASFFLLDELKHGGLSLLPSCLHSMSGLPRRVQGPSHSRHPPAHPAEPQPCSFTQLCRGPVPTGIN